MDFRPSSLSFKRARRVIRMDYSQNIILPKFKQKCNVILKLTCQQFTFHPIWLLHASSNESQLSLTWQEMVVIALTTQKRTAPIAVLFKFLRLTNRYQNRHYQLMYLNHPLPDRLSGLTTYHYRYWQYLQLRHRTHLQVLPFRLPPWWQL